MLPKVENSSDKDQLRTLTQQILDFSEVRRVYFSTYGRPGIDLVSSVGDSTIFTGHHNGPIRLSCRPRTLSPPLPASLRLCYPA